MPTTSVVLAALMVTLVAHPIPTAGCGDATDCSLLGDCVGGACRCDPGWTGDTCGVLMLKANPEVEGKDTLAYIAPDHYSSWGMSVIHDITGDKKWHGFVSEFMHGCKLGSWGTNSYVNHIVADTPAGPWSQAGQALPVWAHNPKVVRDDKTDTWIMFHIGGATNDTSRVVNCTSGAADPAPPRLGHRRPVRTAATPVDAGMPSPKHPFQIATAKTPYGPWTPLRGGGVKGTATNGGGDDDGPFPQFTAYPGVDNIGGKPAAPLTGGVTLHEKAGAGNGGKFFVPFSDFVGNPHRGGALAWDACGGATFDNGHPIETASGSSVAALEVTGGDGTVLAGSPCDLHYDYTKVVLTGPYSRTSGVVAVVNETNYLEVYTPSVDTPGIHEAGATEDAPGCRGVCETTANCTSYTWDARAMAFGGRCWLRSDSVWAPNTTDADPAMLVSGRPWHNDGDNPAPYLDPVTGEVTVLYRCDSEAGLGGYKVASLIGAMRAPSWQGPYHDPGPFGGSISNQQYPFDENEDPFTWKSKRGFHGLFHANTWVDSRSQEHPVPVWAGRLAWSPDGGNWTYSDVPAYNGTVAFANGSKVAVARMERPVLLFDEITGNPTYLINGVQTYAEDDFTFTLTQAIEQ